MLLLYFLSAFCWNDTLAAPIGVLSWNDGNKPQEDSIHDINIPSSMAYAEGVWDCEGRWCGSRGKTKGNPREPPSPFCMNLLL